MSARCQPYSPPAWCAANNHLPHPPRTRVPLIAARPTPMHDFDLAWCGVPLNLQIKRDDETACVAGGNKLRKLEFLLAEALEQSADAVITIGGIQSNHCRATASAARQLGMQPHIILRGSEEEVDEFLATFAASTTQRVRRLLQPEQDKRAAPPPPPSPPPPSEASIRKCTEGNLMFSLMIGAEIWLVTRSEYVTHGSVALTRTLQERLRDEYGARHPYVIPVGGSNGCGTWGYIGCVDEIFSQTTNTVTHVVVATGSGGTAAGLAIGLHLHPTAQENRTKLTCYCVCDDEEYFYTHAYETFVEMGAHASLLGVADDTPAEEGWKRVRDSGIMEVRQAKGLGYAVSRPADIRFVSDVAMRTGLIFDPVYTGKALRAFCDDVKKDPEAWAPRVGGTSSGTSTTVVFVHTGGAHSVSASAVQMAKDAWF